LEGERNEVKISERNVKLIIKPSSTVETGRLIEMGVEKAGLLPTSQEIRDAIIAVYTAEETTPRSGDIVFDDNFHYLIKERKGLNTGVNPNDVFLIIFHGEGESYA